MGLGAFASGWQAIGKQSLLHARMGINAGRVAYSAARAGDMEYSAMARSMGRGLMGSAFAPFKRPAAIMGLAGAGIYGYRGSRRRGRGVIRSAAQGAGWAATAYGGYRGIVAGGAYVSRMIANMKSL